MKRETQPKIGDIWYRYQDYRGYCQLLRYKVDAITPKVVWLVDEYQVEDIWVSLTARKRRAYPDTEQAWTSFKYRTAHRRLHAQRRLHEAEATLRHCENEYTPRVGPISGYAQVNTYAYADYY